jgi:hypothetical protein
MAATAVDLRDAARRGELPAADRVRGVWSSAWQQRTSTRLSSGTIQGDVGHDDRGGGLPGHDTVALACGAGQCGQGEAATDQRDRRKRGAHLRQGTVNVCTRGSSTASSPLASGWAGRWTWFNFVVGAPRRPALSTRPTCPAKGT